MRELSFGKASFAARALRISVRSRNICLWSRKWSSIFGCSSILLSTNRLSSQSIMSILKEWKGFCCSTCESTWAICFSSKGILRGFKKIDCSFFVILWTAFVKIFAEFFYHDVVLTKILSKYSDTLMNDPEIKKTVTKLRL